MVHLIADDNWIIKDLTHFVEPVEVYDVNGRLLGLFVPANLERGKVIYQKLAERVNDPELQRRLAEKPGGRAVQDVLSDLQAGKLTAPANGVASLQSPPQPESHECAGQSS